MTDDHDPMTDSNGNPVTDPDVALALTIFGGWGDVISFEAEYDLAKVFKEVREKERERCLAICREVRPHSASCGCGECVAASGIEGRIQGGDSR